MPQEVPISIREEVTQSVPEEMVVNMPQEVPISIREEVTQSVPEVNGGEHATRSANKYT